MGDDTLQSILDRYLIGRVLDLGFAARPLNTKKSIDLRGVDIQECPLPRGYSEVKTANLNTDHIPYEDHFFDVVHMGQSLDCFSNPVRVLCEANRVLVSRGVCLVTVSNPIYYLEILRNLFTKKYPALFYQRLYSLSRVNMRSLAQRAHLSVLKEYGTYVRVPLLGKRIPTTAFPGLSISIAYVMQKQDDIESHSIVLGRGFGSGEKSKEFMADAALF